jgi:hypothetical protein
LASVHFRCSSVASAFRISRGKRLEAVGLTGLALQAFDLAFQLADDVVETLEVGFGAAQAQFGLMAARMQAGNAGGFFQQRRRACGLAWISSPMRPCPTMDGERAPVDCIGEQKLHVLGAGVLAVDLVGRSGFALDAAGDLERVVGMVEGGGRGAVGIVEKQRDLGRVARRAVPEPEKITSSMPDARMFL